MRGRDPVLSTILLLLGAGAIAAPDIPVYSVTDLKALGIWPVAMNEKGEVLGRACCGRQSAAPQLYTGGNVRDLGLPPGGYSSFTPQGINDSSWVVGHAEIPSSDPAARVSSAAFHDGNGWTVIDTSAFGTITTGTVINDAGQVVGTTQNVPDTTYTPWLYQGGTLTRLAPGPICFAGDISENGQVVGSCGFDFSPRSWLYHDGQLTDLPAAGRATAVNDAGTVLSTVPRTWYAGVGWRGPYDYILQDGVSTKLPGPSSAMNERSELAGGFGFPRATIYRSGSFVDLGTLGGTASGAQSLNNRGQVAGWSLDAESRKRVFVYDGGVMLDVADLRGVGSGLQFNSALWPGTTINDSLYVLVAVADYSTEPDTLDAAYLLTPMAPTVTLAATPTQAPVRQPVALTWVSENANRCVASGGTTEDGWAGMRATSGETTVMSGAAGDVQYAIRCTAGPLSGEATVSVRYEAAPPTVRLSATPSETRVGRSVTLAWTSEGADSCVATGGRPGDGWTGALGKSGQTTISEAAQGIVEYGLRCTAAALASEAKVSVTYTKKSGGGGSLDALGVLLLGLGLSRRKAN
jgi:probable HAF family extracellular repeat protein